MASFVNEVIAKLKAKVKLRGGINGINALAKVLKIQKILEGYR